MEPFFPLDRDEFRSWLTDHNDTADELWVGYYKKDAEQTGISYAASVEEALCFGWIDSTINGIDDVTYKRRFTPRNPNSKWSKINKNRVQKMIEEDKMTAAGYALIEAGRESGEWEKAYRLADDHEIPPALKTALTENETAWENFRGLSNTNQHAYITKVEDAKTTETEEKRIGKIVKLAEKNLSLYDNDGKSRM